MTRTTSVLIMRGQLAHLAHHHLLQRALELSDQVIVVLGSAWRSRNPKNPFVFDERKQMLLATLTPAHRARVRIVGVRDVNDDDRWVALVRQKVAQFTHANELVSLIGFQKANDASTYYLMRFPGWQYVNVGSPLDVNATTLRELYFGGNTVQQALSALAPFVHEGVLAFLADWAHTDAYAQRCAEHRAVAQYKRKYPGPRYQTADAIVEVEDHVLLVQRGQLIGLDCWALPGGFRNPDEEALSNAIRELIEETGLPVTTEQLRAALVAHLRFDAEGRSPRGRIETDAFHFRLSGMRLADLPVVGMDDAKRAKWVHKRELPNYMHEMLDDHDLILERAFGEMVPTAELLAA
jgi:bifunctional NMN adenylyltransferase/nudix hydrolase